MNSLRFRLTAVAVVVLVTIGFAACMNPLSRLSGGAKGGELTVTFNNAINSRTLLPGISMNVGSYSITGSGPGGATFSGSSTGDTVSFDKLAFGTWTVTAEAYNDANPAVMIGSGTATTVVHTGEHTGVTVTVVPLSGTGTLSLDVSWNAGDIETPAIDASLIPTTGATRTLDFTLGDGTANFSADDVATGYHTLTLQLLDNGIVTAGAVEMVRIVKDASTKGTFAFTQVNRPGGTIDVSIDPELADPIEVAMSGVSASITEGQTMTVSASVPAGTPNVSYVWYVNGASVGTGSPFTFGSTLTAGHYRLDVTAITADGTRAGSATGSFDVAPAVVTATGAQWARTDSAGSGGSAFNGVAVDPAGNLYAAGYISGTNPYDFGHGVTVTGVANGKNIVLVKYNASGSALWARTVRAGTDTSVFNGIAVDEAGDIYATGTIFGTTPYDFGGDISAAGTSGSNIVIVKYNSSGTAQWARTVSTENNGHDSSQFVAVAADSAGDSYAAGYIGDGTYDFGGGITVTGLVGTAVVLVKYDSTGTALWARTAGLPCGASKFWGVSVDSADNSYAAGTTIGLLPCDFGRGVTSQGNTVPNGVLVKYDSLGTVQWAHSVSALNSTGFESSQFNAVAADSAGNSYAAGYVGLGAYDFGSGVTASGNDPDKNPLIVKYDTSGAVKWARTGSGHSASFNAVTLDSAGNVYAAGHLESAGSFEFGGSSAAVTSLGGYQVVLVKYDSSGTARWARTVVSGGGKNSVFTSVALDSKSKIYAAGYIGGTDTYDFGSGVTAAGTYASGLSPNIVVVKYAIP